MVQNRDRNWQDRDQPQGGGRGRGGWQGGEDFGQDEQNQHHGFAESQGQGQFGSGQQPGWQGGGYGPQQGGEWNRMGRYGEEGWQGGGQGRFGQGGNYRMDRDDGRQGGGFGTPYVGEQGGWGSGSGGSSYGNPGYGGSFGQQGGGQQRGFWDRASDEVSAWFGDDQARRRREMDEHRGRGPRGYTRSDERIREDVNDRLTDDGWLDASDIEVDVSGSEVTLTGQVASREEKRRAEDIADAVSGVKHVQNNLRVKDRSAATAESSLTQSGSSGSRVGGSATSSGSTGGSSASGLSGSRSSGS